MISYQSFALPTVSLVLAVVGVYAGLLPPVERGGPLADPHGAPPEAGLHLAPQLGDARLAAETTQERGLLPLQQGPALTQYKGSLMDFGIVSLIVHKTDPNSAGACSHTMQWFVS